MEMTAGSSLRFDDGPHVGGELVEGVGSEALSDGEVFVKANERAVDRSATEPFGSRPELRDRLCRDLPGRMQQAPVGLRYARRDLRRPQDQKAR